MTAGGGSWWRIAAAHPHPPYCTLARGVLIGGVADGSGAAEPFSTRQAHPCTDSLAPFPAHFKAAAAIKRTSFGLLTKGGSTAVASRHMQPAPASLKTRGVEKLLHYAGEG